MNRTDRGKRKTLVMGRLIAKFRRASMKPAGRSRRRRRAPKPFSPKPKLRAFRRTRRRYARPKR